MDKRTTDEGIYTNEWYTTMSDYYRTPYDMFENNGNCLHYAISRVQEIAGIKFPKFHGNAIDVANLSFLQRLESPTFGSLAVFGGTYTGHIAVVEYIYDNGDVLVSESSWQSKMFQTNILHKEQQYSECGLPLIGFYLFNGVTEAIEREKKIELEEQKQKEEQVKEYIMQNAIERGHMPTPPSLLPVDGFMFMGTIGFQFIKKVGVKTLCNKKRWNFFHLNFFSRLTYNNDNKEV